MEEIVKYIKPELVILIAVIYVLGVVFKQTNIVKDKQIPLVLICIGIVLATLWVLATTEFTTMQDIFMAIFIAITQGVLVSAGAVGLNQAIIVQPKRKE